MRKAKRFTPALIRRLQNEGRGQGIRQDFNAFHQVKRGDPPSRGTSSIIPPMGQFSAGHLLSVAEGVSHEFSTMVPRTDDRRHQVPLSRDSHSNCIVEYSNWDDERIYPGTLEICENLGIRHPRLRLHEDIEQWILTTDIVLTLLSPAKRRRLLAISVKDVPFSQLTKRNRDLLRV